MTNSPQPPPLYIGLMSGTSLDGVDAVLVAIPDDYSGGALTTAAAVHQPFTAELRAQLMALQTAGHNEIEREALIANELARIYAASVAQLLAQNDVDARQVRAIGVHGQTIRHRPDLGFTRQTNNPALLAELTGIDVIADFRSSDIAASGQGAPLVPAFHQAVFGKQGETRVIVNLGGIANISVLHRDGNVTGFDTGPGNMLMDAWIARHQGVAYDEGGKWAASGRVFQVLLGKMLAEPYLSLPPPKSTGRDLFHLDWLAAVMDGLQDSDDILPQDVQSTLLMFTAITIAKAISEHAAEVAAIYVCGGGAKNSHLMQQLQELHPSVPSVDSTITLDISPDHVEALAFAWLAQRFCLRKHGNLPAVTGAQGGRVLGALYPA